jgi:alkyl sulfatase BDS1-like metallo-beta-lactamase superfamily hydrolase
VWTCNYPPKKAQQQKKKTKKKTRSVHPGHETEDMQVLGVFANLRDANQWAREIGSHAGFHNYESDTDVLCLKHKYISPCGKEKTRCVWVEEQEIEY